VSERLNEAQLTIVMHLCNGMTIEETAWKMSYSPTNVKRHIARAKRMTGARSTIHLVSIVIASGDLVWSDDDNERTLHSEVPPRA
jgi:DNA-binding CsgD family transcriptional regulator